MISCLPTEMSRRRGTTTTQPSTPTRACAQTLTHSIGTTYPRHSKSIRLWMSRASREQPVRLGAQRFRRLPVQPFPRHRLSLVWRYSLSFCFCLQESPRASNTGEGRLSYAPQLAQERSTRSSCTSSAESCPDSPQVFITSESQNLVYGNCGRAITGRCSR